MRRVSLIRVAGGLFTAFLIAGAPPESIGAERYDADLTSSRVTIEGTSTLHNWHVEGRHLGGYVLVQEGELASLWSDSGPSLQEPAPTVSVEIPVTSLTSGNRGMDENMHKALKATTSPMITYRLELVEIPRSQTAQADVADASLTIPTKGVLTVAGVERTVDLPMQVRRLPSDRLEISGETSLRMTNFGIDPPRAMLGTLQTGDEVRVHWTWVLTRDRSQTP